MAKDQVKVLLVEDDEDDYVLVKNLLAEARSVEFSLDWVENYNDGLAAMRRRKHDVYLLDYRLGNRTGLELIHEFSVEGFDVPMIFLTGQRAYEIDSEAIRLGAADYLVKGQTTPDLLERSILHSIERKRAEGELKQYREHLEELVRERTIQLERINESLQLEIAERKQAEKDRTRLITELQNALTKVKLLSGLLPICASCKRIRDDKGYWRQIEVYIREHSEAEFSHGICPDCVTKLYPWFLQDHVPSKQRLSENNRRKYYRYHVRDGAILALSGLDIKNISKIGDIVNISEGGLSFVCRLHNELVDKELSMAIYGCVDPKVFIDSIPCKIVYKYAFDSLYSPGDGMRFHRVGVQFGELHEHQRSQLQFFIQYYGKSHDGAAADA